MELQFQQLQDKILPNKFPFNEPKRVLEYDSMMHVWRQTVNTV